MRQMIFDASGVSVLDNLESLRQRVLGAVRLFRGEWFLDTSAGIPYITEFASARPDPVAIAVLVNRAIVRIDGIAAVTDVELAWDPATRRLGYASMIHTESGELLPIDSILFGGNPPVAQAAPVGNYWTLDDSGAWWSAELEAPVDWWNLA